MTDTMDSKVKGPVLMSGPPATLLARKIPTEDLAAVLLERAESEALSLVGPGGLLAELTKRVLEAGLEAELTEHVGYAPYDPAGHHSGNSRNGTRSKTVITDVGPVELAVRGIGRGRSSRSWSRNGNGGWAGRSDGPVVVSEGSDSW